MHHGTEVFAEARQEELRALGAKGGSTSRRTRMVTGTRHRAAALLHLIAERIEPRTYSRPSSGRSH
jgi:hypothetical protein